MTRPLQVPNYAKTRASGAGRPPGSKNKIVEPEGPPPDLAVFVEGRVRVSGDDAEAFENIGRLRDISQTLGLAVQAVEVTRDDLTGVRRSWGSGRVPLDFAEGYIKEFPGITFLQWAEKVFLAGEPMTAPTFEAARAKAKVALSRLWRLNRVRKSKNEYGQLTLWPSNSDKPTKPDNIPADILLAVNEAVEAILARAKKEKKHVSSKIVATVVAEIVWKKRLFYEK